MISALPWTVRTKPVPTGHSIQIVDARGGVVALMKAGGARKMNSALAIVEAMNAKASA